MAFKKCRKCGHAFVPEDYDHCPKCDASVAHPAFVRWLMLGAFMLAGAGFFFYLAVFVLPRVSISLQ